MGTQPGRHSVRGALGQKINRALLCEIHQDGAIDAALPEGKIIDPEHPWGRLDGCRGAAENPEDRIATQRHPQASRHPCAGFAASLASEDPHGLGQPPCPLRMPEGQRREAFGKGPAGTRGRETAEPPDGQAEVHRGLCNREISPATGVAAMHAG